MIDLHSIGTPEGFSSCAMRVACVASLVGTVLANPSPARAQTSSVAEIDSTPVCMLRPYPSNPHVPVERRGQPFRILTIEASVPALEDKGFSRVDCTTADLVRADKRGSWRDEICELAATGNTSVQNQLERALGERPAVLCAGAQAAAGEWDRTKPVKGPKGKGDQP